MLACPRCREELKPVAMLGGFLWACPTCGGRAGTLALLKHRTPKAALSALREAARAADRGGREAVRSSIEPYLGFGPDGESTWVGEEAWRCPSCAQPLPRVAVPAHGISDALDVCPRCDLVWFERTAMSALPLKPTLPARPRPYPRRASLDGSGRHLAWRHDRGPLHGPSAVVIRPDGAAGAALPDSEPPGHEATALEATPKRRSCVGRLLLLVAVGICLGATAATVAPHALRDAGPAVLAVAERRWGDLVGGAIPFLGAVAVTAGFWMSARRRTRRRMAESAPPT